MSHMTKNTKKETKTEKYKNTSAEIGQVSLDRGFPTWDLAHSFIKKEKKRRQGRVSCFGFCQKGKGWVVLFHNLLSFPSHSPKKKISSRFIMRKNPK